MSKSEILQIIKNNPNITQTALCKIIGRNRFHCTQLYSLIKEGTVERKIPSDNHQTWILNTTEEVKQI